MYLVWPKQSVIIQQLPCICLGRALLRYAQSLKNILSLLHHLANTARRSLVGDWRDYGNAILHVVNEAHLGHLGLCSGMRLVMKIAKVALVNHKVHIWVVGRMSLDIANVALLQLVSNVDQRQGYD